MENVLKERKPQSNARSEKKRGATAEEMALGQKEVSVSEFFVKNRHLLGFDNPRKSLLTTVKEAVDNGLIALFDALKFHEAGDFSHDGVP